ncbi:hypothetical protein [Actinoplanes regularis]|nr:hypothetical protein [Actinoplanes regularis]
MTPLDRVRAAQDQFALGSDRRCGARCGPCAGRLAYLDGVA